MNNENTTKEELKKIIKICPNCGSKLRYYHAPEGISRGVCTKQCQGWKVEVYWDRNPGQRRINYF